MNPKPRSETNLLILPCGISALQCKNLRHTEALVLCKPSPRRRKQMEPNNRGENFRESSATENRAGREEQPEGVRTYILSLLVTTVVTCTSYGAPSRRASTYPDPLWPHARPIGPRCLGPGDRRRWPPCASVSPDWLVPSARGVFVRSDSKAQGPRPSAITMGPFRLQSSTPLSSPENRTHGEFLRTQAHSTSAGAMFDGGIRIAIGRLRDSLVYLWARSRWFEVLPR
jgi:hypothetical protein